MSLVRDPAHWDDRYQSAGQSVSWYEQRPTVSLELLDALGVEPHDSVIDVGGGASTLTDHLLENGHDDLTVLDLSAVALSTARSRLDEPAGVTWIEADLLSWVPPRRWAVWHERAVLHFLVEQNTRRRYVALLRRALEPRGAFVIGAFAEDGPTHCSALPVRRYSPRDLVEVLGVVEIVEQRRVVHHTPGGAEQPFNWIAGRVAPELR